MTPSEVVVVRNQQGVSGVSYLGAAGKGADGLSRCALLWYS